MRRQGLFHLTGADVEATPDDDVLDGPGDPQVAGFVQAADIPGTPPALVHGGGGQIGALPVLEQAAGTAVLDLAFTTGGSRLAIVDDAQVYPGDGGRPPGGDPPARGGPPRDE